MPRFSNQYVAAFVFMIAVFLVITNSTGAGRVIGAMGNNLALLARTFQGRK